LVVEVTGDPNVVGARAFKLLFNAYYKTEGVTRLDRRSTWNSLAKTETPSAFERAQYIRTPSGWSSWLGYQACTRAHEDDDSERPS